MYFAHQFNIEGPTWFSEASWKNSGYRSAQPIRVQSIMNCSLICLVLRHPIINVLMECHRPRSVTIYYSPTWIMGGIANRLNRSFSALMTQQRSRPIWQRSKIIQSGTSAKVSYCPRPVLRQHPNVFSNITAVTSQAALASLSFIPGKNCLQ